MCKKIGILAIVAVAGVAFLSWAGLTSYTSTAFSNIKSSFKKQVPLEFEIQRVRNEVTQLIPDMKKNLRVMAEEMVAIENLREEIAVTKGNLNHQKENIRTMTRDLESGSERIVYDGREFSANRVREKLERDFASYKTCEQEVKSKEKLLEAKERALDAAREQLASMRSQKQELEVQIAQLEADLKTVRLAQTRSKFHMDDSRLAQCKATLADIRNRLQVEVKANVLEGEFANDAIPVEKKAKPVSELTREIHSYLADSPKAKGEVVVDGN
jgi:DNA repair exonuclease SbcCD ATPase subunit